METNDEKHLMMIEPKADATAPVNDEITGKARQIWEGCTPSKYAFKGIHVCRCGATSDNRDHITADGLKTNSLLVHYVERHRSEVPDTEIAKILQAND